MGFHFAISSHFPEHEKPADVIHLRLSGAGMRNAGKKIVNSKLNFVV